MMPNAFEPLQAKLPILLTLDVGLLMAVKYHLLSAAKLFSPFGPVSTFQLNERYYNVSSNQRSIFALRWSDGCGDCTIYKWLPDMASVASGQPGDSW